MLFQNLEFLEPDPIFQVKAKFEKDQNPDKINLGIGVITDDIGETYRFESLKNISLIPNNNYLPIAGDPNFKQNFAEFFLHFANDENITSIQTVGGTHANYVAGKLFYKMGLKKIYFPNPTWSNHVSVFEEADLQVEKIDYYDFQTQKLSTNFFESLQKLPDNSLVSLDACGHNPTGVDLNSEEINEFAKIAKEKNFLTFVDAAYVGLVN